MRGERFNGINNYINSILYQTNYFSIPYLSKETTPHDFEMVKGGGVSSILQSAQTTLCNFKMAKGRVDKILQFQIRLRTYNAL